MASGPVRSGGGLDAWSGGAMLLVKKMVLLSVALWFAFGATLGCFFAQAPAPSRFGCIEANRTAQANGGFSCLFGPKDAPQASPFGCIYGPVRSPR